MSQESQAIDPAGRCAHAAVERSFNGVEYMDEWICADCRERFYHLDFSNHRAQIRIAEPYATLRDQFAMAAMQAVITRDTKSPDADIAEISYVMADLMMEARKQ